MNFQSAASGAKAADHRGSIVWSEFVRNLAQAEPRRTSYEFLGERALPLAK
jgi:hypothetical protein